MSEENTMQGVEATGPGQDPKAKHPETTNREHRIDSNPKNTTEAAVQTDVGMDDVDTKGHTDATAAQGESAPQEAADANLAREIQEQKQADIERAKRKLDQEAQIAHLNEQVASLRANIRNTNAFVGAIATNFQKVDLENGKLDHSLNQLHADVEARRKRLNGSRAFAAREGNVDAQALIQLFTDFIGTIDDFSYIILSGLNEKSEEHLSKEELDEIRKVMQKERRHLRRESTDGKDKTQSSVVTEKDPNVDNFLRNLMQSNEGPTPMDISDPLIQYLFSDHLYSRVFEPFAPRMPEEKSVILHQMYTDMRKGEPQERSAKWRVLTYQHSLLIMDKQLSTVPSNPKANRNSYQTPPKEAVRDRYAVSNEDVEPFMTKVTKLLGIFNRSQDEQASDELWKAAKHSFSMALKVQEKAKTEYTSFDYEVMFYRMKVGYEGQKPVWLIDRFNPEAMEVVQGPDSAKRVHLTVGLGLNARRSVRDSKGYREETTTPVKAKVVCDNWAADYEPPR